MAGAVFAWRARVRPAHVPVDIAVGLLPCPRAEDVVDDVVEAGAEAHRAFHALRPPLPAVLGQRVPPATGGVAALGAVAAAALRHARNFGGVISRYACLVLN